VRYPRVTRRTSLAWVGRPGRGRSRRARRGGPRRVGRRVSSVFAERYRPARAVRRGHTRHVPTRWVSAGTVQEWYPPARVVEPPTRRTPPGYLHRSLVRPARRGRSLRRSGRFVRRRGVRLLAMLGHLYVARAIRFRSVRAAAPVRPGRRVWRRRRRRRWLRRRLWRPLRRDRRRRGLPRRRGLWWARPRRQHWRGRTRRAYHRPRRVHHRTRRALRDRRPRRPRRVTHRTRRPWWRPRLQPRRARPVRTDWPTQLRRFAGLFVRHGDRVRAERLVRRLVRTGPPGRLYRAGYTSLGTYPRRRGGALVRVPALARPERTGSQVRRWFARAVRSRGERSWSGRAVAEYARPARTLKHRADHVVTVTAGRALL
jgi:hypothetical protein